MDLIDRQAAIEIIQSMYPGMPRIPWMRKDWRERYEPYIRMKNTIRELPSAQPEQRWIPCSERLPAYGEDVLISIGGYCNVGHIVSVNEEEQYNWYFSGWYHLPNDVDAWMPLPKPYKGGQDGH